MSKFVSLFCCMVFISCSAEHRDENRLRARQLFEQSQATIASFRDSIANVNDTVTLNGLGERFMDAITKVNYSYAPDTDLLLTEEENDSLIKTMSQLKEELAKRKNILSIAKDTICDPLSPQ